MIANITNIGYFFNIQINHMKLTYIIITLLTLFCVSAQKNTNATGKVVFEMKANFGQPVTENWFLIFNESKSIFTQDKTFKLQENDLKKNNEEIKIKTEEVLPHIIIDMARDSIYNQVMIFVKPYYVKDKIYKPKWQILKEFKNIGNYKCQKATTNFRGRNYIAWFSEQIPVNFGPWKLNGLPGLILEIEDDMNLIKMTAKSVEINSNLDFDFSTNSIPKIGKQISMRDFVMLKDNESKEIMQYVMSKEDRNAEIELVNKLVKRNGLELTYEWEQNEKK